MPPFTLRRARLPALTCLVAATGAFAAQPPAEPSTKAEFAIRWSPHQGGPRSAEEVLAALRAWVPDGKLGKAKSFEVNYFTLTQPPPQAPGGYETILRRRVEGSEATLTVKFRRKLDPAEAGTRAPLQSWPCPFDTDDKEDEADFSFIAEGAHKKAFSHSCSTPATPQALVKFGAPTAGCRYTMERRKIEIAGSENDLKIETWTVAGQPPVIEVSRNGRNQQDDIDTFRLGVVTPLLKAKVLPLDGSKAQMGGACSP